MTWQFRFQQDAAQAQQQPLLRMICATCSARAESRVSAARLQPGPGRLRLRPAGVAQHKGGAWPVRGVKDRSVHGTLTAGYVEADVFGTNRFHGAELSQG